MSKKNKQKLKELPGTSLAELIKRGELPEFANLQETALLSNSDSRKTVIGKTLKGNK